MRLQGKSALVTGGASGIGKATSLSFAKEGADVTIADISSNQGKETAREIREKGGNASFTELDITKSADVDRTVRDVVARCGKLDILFNSAGIPSRFSILNVTEEEWDRVIAVNLKGIFLCCKFAATHMVHSRNGSIINMGSVSSVVASRNILAYCASKGGVLMLSKAMACDLGQFGVRVNCICPSYVMTLIAESIMRRIPDPDQKIQAITQNYPLRRFAKPEEIANAAVFLASDESTYITGSTFVIDGGSTSQTPTLADFI